MARKRRGREPLVAQQLFSDKLKILFGEGPRRPNPALDALVGKVEVEELDQASPAEPVANATVQPPVAPEAPVAGPAPAQTHASPIPRLGPTGPSLAVPEPVETVEPRLAPAAPEPSRPRLDAVEKAAAAAAASTSEITSGRFESKNVEPYTVYLTMNELADIDFVAKLWSERLDRRFSRSEVMRVAIRTLKAVVEELDDAPNPLAIPLSGENRGRD
ncbi:MAG: hypothetical protein HY329_03475 [Chloroflexi bacterium]|nr:hypothetical protein [Chloroflexota bacterium]